jgi:uncharacterized membrane protein YphA (DoxX/SURF4 family)
MLSREDSRRLAQLERQLQRDDPEFCARMAGGQPKPGPRHRTPLTLITATTVLWLAAIVLGVFTWWIPAVLSALLATATATALAHRLLRGRSHRS